MSRLSARANGATCCPSEIVQLVSTMNNSTNNTLRGVTIKMSSQVVRVQGFSKGSLGAISKEVERDENDLLKNRNNDIDKSRTHSNEFFKHTKNGMYGEWKDVCKNLNISNSNNLKKNAIAFEGMIITSDKEFFKRLGYVQGKEPSEKVKDFFNNAYEFAKQEIGFKGTDNNILSACVHYDETTPHLQLYYVPVVDSWKEKVLQKDVNGKVVKNEKGSPMQARDDKGKLIWNSITNSEQRKLSRDSFWKNKGGNTSYTKMQDRFYEQISKKYGLGRGEKGSTKEHTTKAQWEVQKLNNEIDSKTKELITHEQKIGKLKGELEYAKDGSVAVPQLANKQKTAEIQAQNQALKIEVNKLQQENKTLKIEVKDLREKENIRINAIKDRNSIPRKALDALSFQNIYKNYMHVAKNKVEGLEQFVKPLEKINEMAHEYGQQMVEHKENYVRYSEQQKSAQFNVQKIYSDRDTLEVSLGEINTIASDLNDFRNNISKLEREKEKYSVLQLIKKREIEKKVINYKKFISDCEEILKTKFDMKSYTETDISEKVNWYKNKISECNKKINEYSYQAEEFRLQAQKNISEYKIMMKSKDCFISSVQSIVNRYEAEYEPLQKEYKHDLKPYVATSLPKGKNEVKFEIEKVFEKWQEIVVKSKSDQLLNAYEIKQTKSISKGLSR